MKWNTIRLELARTPNFPGGSVSRAYLLRLPLDGEGMIDWDEVAKQPARATVRRFWASEPDRRGRISHGPGGWALKEVPPDGPSPFQMPPQPIRAGGEVTITADGQELPFRVASVRRHD